MYRLQKRQFFEKFINYLTRFIHLFESVQRPSRAYFVRSINRKIAFAGSYRAIPQLRGFF